MVPVLRSDEKIKQLKSLGEQESNIFCVLLLCLLKHRIKSNFASNKLLFYLCSTVAIFISPYQLEYYFPCLNEVFTPDGIEIVNVTEWIILLFLV